MRKVTDRVAASDGRNVAGLFLRQPDAAHSKSSARQWILSGHIACDYVRPTRLVDVGPGKYQ